MLVVEKPAPESLRLTEHRLRAALRVKSLSQAARAGSRELPCVLQGLDAHVLCIAPGDWLVVSGSTAAAELSQRCSGTPPLPQLAVVDVTYDYAVFELSGPAAREILAKGCGLDLHPERFPPGYATRTRLAKIAVLIDCRATQSFHLYASRSYAGYLQEWLRDAAVEFSLLQSADAAENKTQTAAARSPARPPQPRGLDPGGQT